ncbi:atrial natriuretic peptide receptor 1-like [Paramacrobiotus metropolitanus]|uniref:atrial natriuretic peptide receptor 1-like n=1 Tax=Paramacrobiotus metropolitanus TaxID=2943436 RepID=UPI002445A19F|nr:atrial natriuretic peptide receptor 1-like [Paramacrobiotus metropolitanus]
MRDKQMAYILQIMLVSVVYGAMCTSALLNVSVVAVCYRAPIGFGSLVYLGPALSVATEYVSIKFNTTMRFNLTILSDPVRTTCADLSDNAVRLVSEWHYGQRKKNDLTVFIIPACVETTEMPYFQSQWNNVWISTTSVSPQIRNRQLYPTWIGLNYFPLSQCSQLYVALLNKYAWTSVFFVIDTASPPFYSLLATALLGELRKDRSMSITVRSIATTPGKPYGQFASLLDDIRQDSRVVLYFGHAAFLREFLVTAAAKQMTNGEYVYIAVESMKNKMLGLMHWRYNDSNDEVAFQAFQSLLVVQPRNIYDGPNPTLGGEFVKRSQRDYNFTYSLADQALNDSLSAGENPADLTGITLVKYMLNRTFTDDNGGGTIYVDGNGQRRADFIISYFTSGGSRQPFMQKLGKFDDLEEVTRLTIWANATFPPPNEPFCGYMNQKKVCQPERDTRLIRNTILSLVGAMVIVAVAMTVYIRKEKRKTVERILYDPWWQVTIASIPVAKRHQSSVSTFFAPGPGKNVHDDSQTNEVQESNQSFAVYRGKSVRMVKIGRRDYSVTFQEMSTHHSLLVLLRKFYRLEHQNLCRFLGIAISLDKSGVYTICAATECPPRGTLRDIHSSLATRDFAFISSLIVDYLEALCFLHQSPLRYHGRITPLTCWIDKHFTLKITNYGFDRLSIELCTSCEKMEPVSDSELTEPLYWLTQEKPNPDDTKAMQALDVFSSGFIIYEILTNGALFHKFQALTKDELNELVSRNGNLYHGAVEFTNFAAFESLLRSCWIADPQQRPSMPRLRSRIADISPLLTLSRTKLIDKIYKRLSDYSEDLENLVANRTYNLQEEMSKCDAIIGQFLPRSIVKQLRVGRDVMPELFDSVTVMFTDLSGFVDFVEANSPESTISLIGDTEACFDRLSTRCDVYKVEAVGDSYLVASGLPERIGDNHVQRIAFFALKLMEFESQLTFLRALRFKVGLHSGPCAAGVLGLRRLRYCLFGDTVNLASRMCSQGLPGRVHVSSESKTLLENFPEYSVDRRGTLAIKGTFEMTTVLRLTGTLENLVEVVCYNLVDIFAFLIGFTMLYNSRTIITIQTHILQMAQVYQCGRDVATVVITGMFSLSLFAYMIYQDFITLCLYICIVAGFGFSAMRRNLNALLTTGKGDKAAVEAVLIDHAALGRDIQKLDRRMAVFCFCLYAQIIMLYMWVISSVQNLHTYSAQGMLPSLIFETFLVVAVTAAAIFVAEQADISRELQTLVDTEEDDTSKHDSFIRLYEITSQPTVFSVANMIPIDRIFVASMIGLFISYGVLVTELGDNNTGGGSSLEDAMKLEISKLNCSYCAGHCQL